MIEIERQGDVALVRIGLGPVNPLDLELLEAITATLADLDGSEETRAIVLTGQGRAFSAGVDLKRILDGGEDYTRRFLKALSAAFLAPVRAATPVVAAVNGHAIAGGAVLAAACDLAIATDDNNARIGLSELAVGVPFPAAAIEIMRARLGRHASAAVLLADLYSPVEARDRGFVHDVRAADRLLDDTIAIGQRLAAVPEGVYALSKRQLWAPVEAALALHQPAWDAEVADGWCSAETRAAIQAFAERALRR